MRCTLRDEDWLNRFFAEEENWRAANGDHVPDECRDECGTLLLEDESIYVLRPAAGCVFIARPLMGGIVYECHTFVQPVYRGIWAVQAAQKAMDWVFENTPCRKLVGFTPTWNRPALAFARMCGFHKEGQLKKSHLKNGVLYDHVVFGLTKDEVTNHG